MRPTILVAILVVPCPAFAQEVQPIAAEQLQRIATRLSEEVADIDDPQIEIQPDVAQAVGLKIREDGVVCLPHSGLSEETIEENAHSESGTALAYLFMSENFVPLLDGQPIEESQLRIITLTTDQGTERNIKCFLLSARQVAEDDWRLYSYGATEEPLIDSKFEPADTSVSTGLVSLNIAEVEGTEGTLRLTVFGKYRAGMRLSYRGD